MTTNPPLTADPLPRATHVSPPTTCPASSDMCDEPALTCDVSGNTWDLSLLDDDRACADRSAENLYVYHNTFNLLSRGIARMSMLKTLKFFANNIEALPAEVGDLAGLERLQMKVSSPGVSGVLLSKLECLRELELSMVPPRLSAFSVLSEISGLSCLTKLSVCHFNIRYLPPEIGCLKQLEELDLSFNKLKKLPNDISELGSLRSLIVANNKLTDLPPGISLLKNLKSLDLSNNRLTSLTTLRIASMQALQYLDLQYNKLPAGCYVPSWVSCNFTGNVEDSEEEKNKGATSKPLVDAGMHDSSILKLNRSCNSCLGTSSCLHSDASLGLRYHGSQMMKRKGWKRRDLIQQRARQEHLNYSRKCKGEDNDENMTVKMVEESSPSSDHFALQVAVEKERSLENSTNSDVTSDDTSHAVDTERSDCVDGSSSLISQDSADSEKIGTEKSKFVDDHLHPTSISMGLNEESDLEVESGDKNPLLDFVPTPNVSVESTSRETSIFVSKSKRHSEKVLANPKPSKCLRPVEESSDLSCKYSARSFCSVHDILPDGFYDAGRDRPHRSLEDYEKSLCLNSREVILLDREKDEELDAIVFSAQLIMSRLKRACPDEANGDQVDTLHRASVLALFVSDCFGGSERSDSVMRTRRLALGALKQQPFVCTCPDWGSYKDLQSKQIDGSMPMINFLEMCEKSIRSIKETRKSNIVPIGTLQFGVCRHRAVLMKYLCDRVNPPIPCELVRGYLDFTPHAWNAIPIRRGNSLVRMIFDTCYPTDIREETDPEYFSRYIPLIRLHDPLNAEDMVAPESLDLSVSHEAESDSSNSVVHSKFGTIDAAFKIRNLEADLASGEEVRNFEYKFLGEVRILGALRKHRCIVDIYGHQLSSEWVLATDKKKDHRLLKSVIIMEYIKGGSLKNYINKLSEQGEKRVPIDVALHIAREVACALTEMHSKLIIHRDVKSENILIDLDSNRADGMPLVKLSDFDRSVPLHSDAHTCCIAHLGIHPPDACVGTPRWMAPEVVHAMHRRNPYGLEIDIWSYGCVLLELLTLQIPFQGQSETDVYNLLQIKQRPALTPELENLVSSKEPMEKGISEEAEKLKFLVNLFYKCTRGNPGDRSCALDIYDSLCAFSASLSSDSGKAIVN